MKQLSLLLVATAITFNAGAQDDSDPQNELVIGAKIGTNYSNVYDAQGDNFVADPKFGWVAGGFMSIPVGRYLGIQPELLFSQKGFKATGTLLGGNYDLTRTTNYLDVPIFVAFKPTEFLTILAGPQYSYLLKQKDVFANGTTTTAQEKEFENDNIRKNTLCFIGGLDINFDNHTVLGLRAGWDVQSNNGDGTSTTPRYKNVWYQATLGYRFY